MTEPQWVKHPVLCKLNGKLVLVPAKPPNQRSGQCPQCGEYKFKKAKSGWTECQTCDFAFITNKDEPTTATKTLHKQVTGKDQTRPQ